MKLNLFAAIPEIFMVAMILFILMVEAFSSDSKKSRVTVLSIITLVITFVLQVSIYTIGTIQVVFNNMFILDSMAQGMKLVTYIIGIVTILYVKQYVHDTKMLKGEFYIIFLFSIFGMQVMISANNMLILYVGLELLSLALYGMVALRREEVKATEAAMKFFILGALASGLLLYGISFIYGATGHLELENIFKAMYQSAGLNSGLMIFGVVFVVAGLVFKLGLVPFHMWVPDVYEGSPMAVVTVIGSVTKIASVIFVIRFLIGGLVLLSPQWTVMLSFLAFLSLFLGNIVAIAQTNIKRLLGYSTVAHMGFVAFGLMTVSINGVSAVMFYIVIYAITALAGFGVLTLLSRGDFECEKISDLKGLSKTHPVYAGIMLLVMLSLAGIPPLAGFYAKFQIIKALIASGFIRSAIFAVVMSLIGAFYYLRVIKVMYFEEESSDDITVSKADTFTRSVLVFNGLLLIIIGILPATMVKFCTYLITG